MDRQTEIRMQILAKGALRLVFVLHHKPNKFVLLPVEDHGTPEFAAMFSDAIANGWTQIGVIALRSTEDGQPLVEDEAMPGVSEKDMEAARQLFREELISEGVLDLNTPRN